MSGVIGQMECREAGGHTHSAPGMIILLHIRITRLRQIKHRGAISGSNGWMVFGWGEVYRLYRLYIITPLTNSN